MPYAAAKLQHRHREEGQVPPPPPRTAACPPRPACAVPPQLRLGEGDLVVHQRAHLRRGRGEQLPDAADCHRSGCLVAHRVLRRSARPARAVRRPAGHRRSARSLLTIMPPDWSSLVRRCGGQLGEPAVFGGLALQDLGHPEVVFGLVLLVDVRDAVAVLVALLVRSTAGGTVSLRSLSRTAASTAETSRGAPARRP